MSWFTDFVLGRSDAPSMPVTAGPNFAGVVSKATSGSLRDFAERFRSRNVDTYDPNVTTGDSYTDEHLGAEGLTVEQVRAISKLRPVSMFMSLGATQIGRHGRLRKSRTDVGYEIMLRDPKKTGSRAAQRMAKEISDMLERGVPMHRKMQMLASDSMPLDLAVGEITFAKGKNSRGGNKPYGWMAYDAATYRLAQLKAEQAQSGRAPFHRPVIQYEHGLPVNVFAPEEVLWIIRRPRTEQSVQGWGFPEIVEAAETMATLVKAHRFNDNFFENGTHAKFFLKFKMAMTPEQWESFKRQFQEQLKGLDNAHKIGTILLGQGQQGVSQPEDVEKLSLSESPKDMEFRWGFGFYYRELAAILGVDLEELGMGDPADTGRATLQERDTGQRILMARERRLEPALKAFEDEMDVKLVQPYDEDFCIRFLGMGILSAKEQAELDKSEVESSRTWNEIRARQDLPQSKQPWADECPLNPVAAQLYKDQKDREMAEKQQAQQLAQGAQPQPGVSVDEQEEAGGQPEPDGGDDFGFGESEAA